MVKKVTHLMKKYILFILFSYSTIGISQKISSSILNKEQIKEREVDGLSDFPIYKAYEYQDKGEVYELVLGENHKTISKKDTLNTKIQAVCVVNDHGGFIEKWRINDLIENTEPKETSIWFWTKYSSIKDIDGDGYIEPVIVYGTSDEDDYVKRVKIITVYKGTKYVIRAVECDLDYCRSFKKDKNWNLLPQKIKTYIDQLVIKMRKEQNLLLKDG